MLTILMACAGPAGAAFPGPNGRIAFSRETRDGDEIVVASPGGSSRKVVTTPQNYFGGESSFLNPAYAPDGARLVMGGGGGGLWTVYANGARMTKVFSPRTSRYESAQDPSWSPNGRRILFDLQSKPGSGGRTGLWSIRADGSGLRRILGGNEFDPVLSPDGSQLAYTKLVSNNGPTWDLEVARPNGSHPVNLYSGAGFDAAPARVSWSPDSRTLVFGVGAAASGIDAVSASGGPVRTLIGNCTASGSSCAVGTDPDYSPDGKRIVYTRAFAAAGQPWSFEIWSMRPDGSDRRREIRGTPGTQPTWGRTPTIAMPNPKDQPARPAALKVKIGPLPFSVSRATLVRGWRIRVKSNQGGTITVVGLRHGTTVATGRATRRTAGRLTVTVRLTATGRRAIKKGHSTMIDVRSVFTTPTHRRYEERQPVTVD